MSNTSISDREKMLVDAAVAASARTRYVMVLSQLFGLLTLVVLFNGAYTDWYSQRLRVLSGARMAYLCEPVDYVTRVDRLPAPPLLSLRSVPLLPRETKDGQRSRIARDWAAACQRKLSVDVLAPQISRGIEYILRDGADSLQIEARITNIESLEKDNAYSVPVPFVGIKIDVNDFGLLGSVAHLSILAWLLLAVRRETQSREIPLSQDAREVAFAHNFFTNVHPENALSWPLWPRLVCAVVFALVAALMIWSGSAWVSPAGITIIVIAPLAISARWSSVQELIRSVGLMAISGVTVILPLLVLVLQARSDVSQVPAWTRIYPSDRHILPLTVEVTIEAIATVANAAVTGYIVSMFARPTRRPPPPPPPPGSASTDRAPPPSGGSTHVRASPDSSAGATAENSEVPVAGDPPPSKQMKAAASPPPEDSSEDRPLGESPSGLARSEE